ncbi:MAG TPA: Ig-like domain-containing protein [Candidatus Binatia bacterium]|jgi:hypothetical protein|nr:Ig-like domain-containing protein [Candidatus Binatia bacterium]
MKMMKRLLWPWQQVEGFVVTITLALAGTALAQSNTTFPVVTLQATDPFASWSGDTGTITAFRRGDPSQTLNVFYRISGTASNGVDYQTIGNYVQIPSGVYSNTIVITPINNGQTTIKTVTLQLAPSPTLQPVNYTIGYPSNATVYIRTNGADIPPVVSIFSPTNGAVFYTPVNVQILAKGSDPDGFVTNVEFFAGTTDLGPGHQVVLDPPGVNGVVGPVWFLTWSNPAPATYALTAVATDNGGASTTSDPVKITVNPGPPPNIPPTVSILTPTNGATFFTPVNIPICADARDADGYVATVEFFAGTNSLGVKTNNPMSAGPMNPFCLVWSNAPAGSYPLTAVATDNGGASTVSAAVNITVQAGPPPTNFPPVVRIASPPNGSVFRAPVNIPIYAYAFDPDGYVASVEFFADATSLGQGHQVIPPYVAASGPNPGPILITLSNIWALVWSNAPPGTNVALTAKATDNGGASTISAPVTISILPPLPPPTNRPPVVSIFATDPIAIEGTNCWPWLGLASTSPTWSDWVSPTAVCRFFTNCGPKDASFTVRRFGDTNGDLVVAYAVGGTATNGVDYVGLSGVVTVPAGERSAAITVVPIDDGPPDITSTVVLKLAPSTNVPPDYLLGYPRNAAAIILDRGPRPPTGMLPDKCFHLGANGPDGAWFHVDYSADMVNWTSICTNQVINGAIDFVDPDAQSDQARFYRAVPESGPPPY